MEKTPKYPNPALYRAKNNIDWKAQWKNFKEVAGIFGGMLKETDWKKFGQDWVETLKADGKRISEEYRAFAACTPEEKLEAIRYGEKHLGRLYREGCFAPVRREWRGVKDTIYDFYEWARLWGVLLTTFSKDLVPALNSALYYRWMISYFCCHSFMDKNLMGLRGSNLRMSHELTLCMFRYAAENLVLLAKGDAKNGNSAELNKKVVLFDEMTMSQIMGGFPDLIGIPYQLFPVFMVSEMDQLICPDHCVIQYGKDHSIPASKLRVRRRVQNVPQRIRVLDHWTDHLWNFQERHFRHTQLDLLDRYVPRGSIIQVRLYRCQPVVYRAFLLSILVQQPIPVIQYKIKCAESKGEVLDRIAFHVRDIPPEDCEAVPVCFCRFPTVIPLGEIVLEEVHCHGEEQLPVKLGFHLFLTSGITREARVSFWRMILKASNTW